jgi:hypothetical protein
MEMTEKIVEAYVRAAAGRHVRPAAVSPGTVAYHVVEWRAPLDGRRHI